MKVPKLEIPPEVTSMQEVEKFVTSKRGDVTKTVLMLRKEVPNSPGRFYHEIMIPQALLIGELGKKLEWTVLCLPPTASIPPTLQAHINQWVSVAQMHTGQDADTDEHGGSDGHSGYLFDD